VHVAVRGELRLIDEDPARKHPQVTFTVQVDMAHLTRTGMQSEQAGDGIARVVQDFGVHADAAGEDLPSQVSDPLPRDENRVGLG
jgi:hypothetical protein